VFGVRIRVVKKKLHLMLLTCVHFDLITLCFAFYSTLGQGLLTSTYPGEVMFSIVIAIMGLVLFSLLIGNMQVNIKFTL
jgi:hypothetical protein